VLDRHHDCPHAVIMVVVLAMTVCDGDGDHGDDLDVDRAAADQGDQERS
jgi:hypothetical protein